MISAGRVVHTFAHILHGKSKIFLPMMRPEKERRNETAVQKQGGPQGHKWGQRLGHLKGLWGGSRPLERWRINRDKRTQENKGLKMRRRKRRRIAEWIICWLNRMWARWSHQHFCCIDAHQQCVRHARMCTNLSSLPFYEVFLPWSETVRELFSCFFPPLSWLISYNQSKGLEWTCTPSTIELLLFASVQPTFPCHFGHKTRSRQFKFTHWAKRLADLQ